VNETVPTGKGPVGAGSWKRPCVINLSPVTNASTTRTPVAITQFLS
jgi:hypothetical protein